MKRNRSPSASRSPSRSRSPARRSRSPRRIEKGGSRSPRRGSGSRSRSGSRASQVSATVDKVRLSDADAAFILGKGGKTKEKIAKVAGANIELPPRSLTLEITGSAEQRRKAKKYVECVIAQRSGDVVLDETDPHFKSDCSLVEVPTECCGFVTGTNGSFLRQVEAEYGTIMFFVHLKGDQGRRLKGIEKLAIFGERRGRRGAELKVLAAVESRLEGYVTRDLREHKSSNEEWGTDIRKLKADEMSWALGRKGATRKKLARASGCIVEYIGNYVHMAGTGPERRRAGDYLTCIMNQLDGIVDLPIEGRDDVTLLKIPQDCVGFVMGLKRATLSRIEDDSGAFMLFMDSKEESRRKEFVGLGIFGVRRNRRAAELKVMSTVEGKAPGYFTKGVTEGLDPNEWGTDIYRFRGEEFSYALGKDGLTKRKLQRASACIIEYLGDFAFMAGTLAERRRAMRYLKWLLRQRSGAIRLQDLGRHDDLQEVDIPQHAITHFMGAKGSALRAIEEETNTFLFFARDDNSSGDVLVICGADKDDRRHAEHAIHSAMNDLDRRDRAPYSGGDRDRYDDGDSYSKYSRGDSYRRDDRYDDDRYSRGGRRRSRSPSYDSYDSRDRRYRDDRRDRRSRSRSYDRRRSR